MAVNALIEAGETVLSENRFPSAEELSLVTSNASTGHDLILLGMATDCARSLRDTHKALTHLQSTLTTPEIIANLEFEQRILLARTLLEFSKHQHNFIRDVHERVNVAKLHTDIVDNDHKVKQAVGMSKEERRVVRETLTRRITRTYAEQNNGDPDAVEVGAELVEV